MLRIHCKLEKGVLVPGGWGVQPLPPLTPASTTGQVSLKIATGARPLSHGPKSLPAPGPWAEGSWPQRSPSRPAPPLPCPPSSPALSAGMDEDVPPSAGPAPAATGACIPHAELGGWRRATPTSPLTLRRPQGGTLRSSLPFVASEKYSWAVMENQLSMQSTGVGKMVIFSRGAGPHAAERGRRSDTPGCRLEVGVWLK